MNATLTGEVFSAMAENAKNRRVEKTNLKKACKDFESIFLHYILKSARNTLPENKLLDRTHESKMYTSMMDEKLAVSIARGKGTGLADMLYSELSASLGSSADGRNFSEDQHEPIRNHIGVL